MDKRKALTKSRLGKSKLGLTKEGHSESTSKLTKVNLSDPLKKNSTPNQARLSKSKNILNKRTSETPKPKIEDFELKRRSVPSTQENIENYYSSYIKALSVKLEKHTKNNEYMEEELKQMQQNFELEENTMKKDMEKVLIDNKKVKKEKTQLESELMEENFKLRRDFEDYKLSVAGVVNDVIAVVNSFDGQTWDQMAEDVIKKIMDLPVVEETQNVRASLKGTASFSNVALEVFSPKGNHSTGLKEAIVLYPFKAASKDEIDLEVGDRVVVFGSDDESTWWVGKVRDCIGKFPKNCVMLD